MPVGPSESLLITARRTSVVIALAVVALFSPGQSWPVDSASAPCRLLAENNQRGVNSFDTWAEEGDVLAQRPDVVIVATGHGTSA